MNEHFIKGFDKTASLFGKAADNMMKDYTEKGFKFSQEDWKRFEKLFNQTADKIKPRVKPWHILAGSMLVGAGMATGGYFAKKVGETTKVVFTDQSAIPGINKPRLKKQAFVGKAIRGITSALKGTAAGVKSVAGKATSSGKGIGQTLQAHNVAAPAFVSRNIRAGLKGGKGVTYQQAVSQQKLKQSLQARHSSNPALAKKLEQKRRIAAMDRQVKLKQKATEKSNAQYADSGKGRGFAPRGAKGGVSKGNVNPEEQSFMQRGQQAWKSLSPSKKLLAGGAVATAGTAAMMPPQQQQQQQQPAFQQQRYGGYNQR